MALKFIAKSLFFFVAFINLAIFCFIFRRRSNLSILLALIFLRFQCNIKRNRLIVTNIGSDIRIQLFDHDWVLQLIQDRKTFRESDNGCFSVRIVATGDGNSDIDVTSLVIYRLKIQDSMDTDLKNVCLLRKFVCMLLFGLGVYKSHQTYAKFLF